jgi:hypothetical protein
MKTSPDEAIVRAGDFAERVRRNQQQLGTGRTSLAESRRSGVTMNDQMNRVVSC